MPRLPSLRIPALAEFARQLRYQPPTVARRQLENAEGLLGVVEPARTYPQDWVLFRLTGYRAEGAGGKGGDAPEVSEGPALIVGEALRADLPALIEHISVAAGLQESELRGDGAGGDEWLDAGEVCVRWNVSRKTLDRYRRLGLSARRVVGADARHRLMFSAAAVAAFEREHERRVRDAARFQRIDESEAARIYRRATVYRRRLGWSASQAARRMEKRFGRSHEGLRLLILRLDRERGEREGSAARVFDDPAPMHDPERRLILRAMERGIGAEEVAARLRKTVADVYHGAVLARAERLRGLDLAVIAAGELQKPDAEERWLGHPVVSGADVEISAVAPATLAEMLEVAAAMPAPLAEVEAARGAAYWYLRFDARRRIAGLPRHGATAAMVDEIETRLRWAARLKSALVRMLLPSAVRAIESRLERPVTAMPGPAAREVAMAAVGALIEAVDRFDPFKKGRAAGPASMALGRAIGQWSKGAGARWSGPMREGGGAGRATPRAEPATVMLEDWSRRVCPWQEWLEPDARVRRVLGRLEEPLRDVLTVRQGWGGLPPVTVAAMAAARGVTAAQVVRLEREAMRAALALARKGE